MPDRAPVRSRKWVRWPLRLLWTGTLALAVFLVIERYWTRAAGGSERATVIARLDAEDPDWTWEAIDAARGPLPDPDDKAGLPARLFAALECRHDDARAVSAFDHPDYAVNQRIPEEELTRLSAALDNVADLLALSAELRDGPAKLPRVRIAADAYSTTLPNTQAIAWANRLLKVEAERLSHAGRPDEALARSRWMLDAARTIGDEPFGFS